MAFLVITCLGIDDNNDRGDGVTPVPVIYVLVQLLLDEGGEASNRFGSPTEMPRNIEKNKKLPGSRPKLFYTSIGGCVRWSIRQT